METNAAVLNLGNQIDEMWILRSDVSALKEVKQGPNKDDWLIEMFRKFEAVGIGS